MKTAEQRQHDQLDPDVVERARQIREQLQLDDAELAAIAKLPTISADVADDVAALLAPNRRRAC